MKFKKLIILIVFVVILAVLAFVKSSVQKKQEVKKEAQIQIVDLTKDISESFLNKIIIYKGSEEKNKIVFLKKSYGNWVLENKFGLKAKKEVVDNLLKELENLKGELRAESKKVFSDFGVSDTDGAHIVLETEAGKELFHFIVSFTRPIWNSVFVRLSGTEKIVLVQKDILAKINLFGKDTKLDEAYFSDLKICSFDSQNINRVELLDRNKQPVVLIKQESSDKTLPATWKFEPSEKEGQGIDAAKVNEFLQNIINIYAQEALDPTLTDYGFSSPTLQLKLKTLQDEKIIQLDVGPYLESKKAYHVKTTSSNPAFRVADYFIQNLKKDKTYFLKVNPVREPHKTQMNLSNGVKEPEAKKEERKENKKKKKKK